MRPLIGITSKREPVKGRPHVTLPEGYIKAIVQAGGTPVALPVLSDKESILHIVSLMDGLLFSGGGDIHPKFYGDEIRFDMEISPEERTLFEIHLLKAVLERRKPVLGICLGIQSINVALGGTLYQDIPQEVEGHINHRAAHYITIREDSLLGHILENPQDIEVSSAHHQAIKEPGKGLQPVAIAPDGVIEAVELEDYPFLIGVQWHPERDIEDIYTIRLFKAFVEAATRK